MFFLKTDRTYLIIVISSIKLSKRFKIANTESVPRDGERDHIERGKYWVPRVKISPVGEGQVVIDLACFLLPHFRIWEER